MSISRFCIALAIGAATAVAHAEPAQLRVLGNFSGNKKQMDLAERPFFESLSKKVGINTTIGYSPMDIVNVKAADALRLLKSGAFDVASVQIGIAARDEPLFEGLDLAGVAIDVPTQRTVVDAYRAVFDQRLQEKFNAKVLSLWPFGPQFLFCKKPITKLEDFKGTKVRTFTASMATLVEQFGGTPVTLQYGEVYQALYSGVVDCGVTGASAANGGKWPEVTTYLLPLSVSGAMQGHFINLNTWKRFTPEQQGKLQAAFKELEDQMWAIASNSTEDAINCNTGRTPCAEHTKFSMTLGQVTPDEKAELKAALTKAVLPQWGKTCNAVDPKCSAKWNDSVGKAVGLKIN